MSGDNLRIEKNVFSNCTSAVILAVMQNSSKIRISDNLVDKADYAFGSNSISERIVLDNLIISNNKVGQAIYFLEQVEINGH
ncbi:MAG: hypothetical protein IPH57_12730 [Saprospiraceae bacterium]|nr:hypothetical protein [Saprospiraceae bacterium]